MFIRLFVVYINSQIHKISNGIREIPGNSETFWDECIGKRVYEWSYIVCICMLKRDESRLYPLFESPTISTYNDQLDTLTIHA